LSEREQAVWLANIPAVWAEEVLRERGESLSSGELYRMMRLSGADRLSAEKARARRWLDER
jgi:hypothetical protein